MAQLTRPVVSRPTKLPLATAPDSLFHLSISTPATDRAASCPETYVHFLWGSIDSDLLVQMLPLRLLKGRNIIIPWLDNYAGNTLQTFNIALIIVFNGIILNANSF